MVPAHKTPLWTKITAVALCAILALTAVAASLILSAGTGSAGSSFSLPALSELDPETRANFMAGIINPDREVRGVWIASVSNINFPSKKGLSGAELKAELDDIILTCKAANLNTIYFQVRPSGDALYNSSIFPTSEFLTGVQGSGLQDKFDPLAYLVDTAHLAGIAVHAWVNPLRITVGSADSPKTDITALAANNPARLHPEWTAAYADGKLYYNAGLPEVRALIADGITEIVKNYDVDGVVFDDYFYPYPVSGATFDDASTYAKYGSGFTSLGDWRRDNINQMVKASYNAVKAVDPECEFGVAPGGVWLNDNGTNNGSATKGFETYTSLYADSIAWVKGGYIDYIAPQIYWQFTTANANFDVLTRWWNAMLSEHPNVKLLISHAAYRTAEWNSGTEMAEQVEYARSEAAYRGSIMYGYAAIKANTLGLRDSLASLYSEDVVYSDLISDGTPVTFTSPVTGTSTTYDSTYIIGKCDAGKPLYMDGKRVSFTKNGYFSVYTALDVGVNSFTFTQGGVKTVFTITRKDSTAVSTGVSYTKLDSFAITAVTPSYDIAYSGGATLNVSVTAPSKSTGTVTLGSITAILKATIYPPDNSTYMKEVYTGTITLPAGTKWTVSDLGRLKFTATRGSETSEKYGASVKVLGYDAVLAVEVKTDDSEMKISTSSWYYDDYTPQATGMRDVAVRQENGYYKLRCGGWISQDNVSIVRGATVALAELKSAAFTSSAKTTDLTLAVTQNVPINGYADNGKFILTLYNVKTDSSALPAIASDNLLFTGVTKTQKGNAVTYTFTLRDADNFYGFEWDYTGSGAVTVKFRNPQTLASGDKPLSGKTILLDAGHGGAETGTTGPVPGMTESNFNLAIVLSLRDKLTALGATVKLTRSEDVTFKLSPDRLDYVNQLSPDLLVSVHQNAMDYNTDITTVRGTVALYWADSGKLISDCVSASVTSALNRYNRGAVCQRLAMVRNPKFPSTLVEVGFLTCVEEVEQMNSTGIDIAAQGIADGILDYYRAQADFIAATK